MLEIHDDIAVDEVIISPEEENIAEGEDSNGEELVEAATEEEIAAAGIIAEDAIDLNA